MCVRIYYACSWIIAVHCKAHDITGIEISFFQIWEKLFWHTQKDLGKVSETAFHCQLWDFVKPCTEINVFTHLQRHLKLKMVTCPYQVCLFQSNVYSTFHAHKSKENQNKMAFRPEIVSQMYLKNFHLIWMFKLKIVSLKLMLSLKLLISGRWGILGRF